MHFMRVCVLLLFVLMSFDLLASNPVIRHPEFTQSLETRWKWAVNKAEDGEFRNGVWIVYTFKRLMDENETIGHFDDDYKGPTVMEILTGTPAPTRNRNRSKETVREEAKRILNEKEQPSSQRKIWKEVAVLIRVDSKKISRVSLSNMELTYPVKSLPILWLGSAENSKSVALLKTLYQNTSVIKLREELISAVALHQNSDLVIPFLRQIATAEQNFDLRKSAIFWLGQTQDPQALKVLLEVIDTAGSVELQKGAVFSISQMNFPEANQALIRLANQKQHREARLEAIFWIGQEGFHQAPKILEQIAFQDSDQDVRQKAVFALSQLKKQLGSPILMRIATNHPQGDVREEAIFWIGQTGAEKEGEMLEKVARHDSQHSVRKKAIFSLSQMKKDIAISGLERIAKTHPELDMRKEAIFWLGQMKDPRAKTVLLQILK